MNGFTIQPPVEAKLIDRELWEIIVGELQKDKEYQKLREKALACKSEKEHKLWVEKLGQRTQLFTTMWLRKYAKAKLTAKNAMMLIDDENEQNRYIWCMCLSFFLGDFLEDVYEEMESIVKKWNNGQKMKELSDFSECRKLVGRFMREALRDETEDAVEFFDGHAKSFKMMMWNKAKGYMNATIKRENEQMNQMELEFGEN